MSSFREIIGMQPSTASTSDSVLVIIDAQNEYADGQLKVRDVEASRAVNKSLLEKYRSTAKSTGKQNVVHIVHQTPAGAPVFTQGTPLEQEFEELKPLDGEKVVTKNYPNSFASTDLHQFLQGIGAKKIVLVGYMAHVCVSTTARAGAELGYDVLVAQDGVSDRDIPGVAGDLLTKVALAEVADAFGTLVLSKDIL